MGMNRYSTARRSVFWLVSLVLAGCDGLEQADSGERSDESAGIPEVDPPEDPILECIDDLVLSEDRPGTCKGGFGTHGPWLPFGACSACLCDVACSSDWHCAVAEADASPACLDGRCLLHCEADEECPEGMACIDHYDQLGGPICMWVTPICKEPG